MYLDPKFLLSELAQQKARELSTALLNYCRVLLFLYSLDLTLEYTVPGSLRDPTLSIFPFETLF